MRDRILEEIRRLAQRDGATPGRAKFEKETGIRYADWYGSYWARWSDAVAEAGLAPNAFQGKMDADALLAAVAAAFRHIGHAATEGELRIYGRDHPGYPGHSTISKRYSRGELIEALREWTAQNSGWDDVAAMLPAAVVAPAAEPTGRRKPDGSVYLIKMGDHYKIGRSDQLEKRVKGIRVALPEASNLEHSITTDDPPGIEAYWHRRFEKKRGNGEWFKLDAADVRAFKRRRFQ